MRIFHVLLISAFIALPVLLPSAATAQEMKPMPAPAVGTPEPVGANGGNLVFLELFAAEDCAFCPAAERNFNDILVGDNIIGFSCMVDYFDSGKPSQVSRPFCRNQQNIYARMMRTGSVYTPQLVINGKAQVPGHDLQKLSTAIQRARAIARPPVKLDIHRGSEAGSYDIVLPEIRPPDMTEGEKFALRLIVVRKHPELSVVSNSTRHRDRAPDNIASELVEGGLWDGLPIVWTVKPPQDTNGDAFIVLVQDRDSAAVLAAAQYDLDPVPAE